MKDNASFSGVITFVGLADLFQILGGNNSTGTLTLTSPYSEPDGRIYFVDGNPVNAALGALQGMDAVYAMFGWTDGTFQFREEMVHAGRLIRQGRMQIVLDALRMLDDGLIEKVGPPSFEDLPHGGTRKTGSGGDDARHVIKGPFIDYMHVIHEEKVTAGKKIVAEDCYGNWVWVILEGTVRITRESAKGPLILAQLGEGCFIGMITSFLFTEYIRSATVTALGDVYLGMLDTQRLSGEYAALSPDFRRLLLSLSGRLRKVTDRTVDLLLKKGHAQGPQGDEELIIRPGAPREAVFSIDEGEGYVMGRTDRGDLPLFTLGKGDVYGYLPFMDLGQEPRFASVLAPKGLKVSRLDMERLQGEYDHLSATLRNMIENMGTCISETTRLACRLGEQGQKEKIPGGLSPSRAPSIL
jgi:CRP-like cAMP-binding protein